MRQFFLRVVRPRCQYLTGHVTVGGQVLLIRPVIAQPRTSELIATQL